MPLLTSAPCVVLCALLSITVVELLEVQEDEDGRSLRVWARAGEVPANASSTWLTVQQNFREVLRTPPLPYIPTGPALDVGPVFPGFRYAVSLWAASGNTSVATWSTNATVITRPPAVVHAEVKEIPELRESAVLVTWHPPNRSSEAHYDGFEISYTQGIHIVHIYVMDPAVNKNIINGLWAGKCYEDLAVRSVVRDGHNYVRSNLHHGKLLFRPALPAPQNVLVVILTGDEDPAQRTDVLIVNVVLPNPTLAATAEPTDTLEQQMPGTATLPDTATPNSPSNGESSESGNFIEGGDDPAGGWPHGRDFDGAAVKPGDLAARVMVQWDPPAVAHADLIDSYKIYLEKQGQVTLLGSTASSRALLLLLQGPGSYLVHVRALIRAGPCASTESPAASAPINISHSQLEAMDTEAHPNGSLQEAPAQPGNVSVRLLDSGSAVVFWESPGEARYDSYLVLLQALDCGSAHGQHDDCSLRSSTERVLRGLTPGRLYGVRVALRWGGVQGRESEPYSFRTVPTGVKELEAEGLDPFTVKLSWKIPQVVFFTRYVVQLFYFDLHQQESIMRQIDIAENTTKGQTTLELEDLIPAWEYVIRVMMQSGENSTARVCCPDSSLIHVTSPLSPEIVEVAYEERRVLRVRWRYRHPGVSSAHSRLLRWELVVSGLRVYKKDVERKVMEASVLVTPGDLYNISVVAFTQHRHNVSAHHVISTSPDSPRAVNILNVTQTSVSLAWSCEGLVDYYLVTYTSLDSEQHIKLEQLSKEEHMTISGLSADTRYNISLVSISHQLSSPPSSLLITTPALLMNTLVLAIPLVLSMALLLTLALVYLMLRRRKQRAESKAMGGTFLNFAAIDGDFGSAFRRCRTLPAFLASLPSCLRTGYFLVPPFVSWARKQGQLKKLSKPVQLDDFEMYIKEMSKDSDYKFSLEYEDLKLVGQEMSHNAASLPVNRQKNRYSNILPYDMSRVKLMALEGQEGSDYINANFIPGQNWIREFIATQGPLPNTQADFWRLVWEQNVRVIVMLTQCVEKGRTKCDRYWPLDTNLECHGGALVQLISEYVQEEWTTRTFKLMLQEEEETREITHYNYTAWPDHGVPTDKSIAGLLQFVRLVRGSQSEPVVRPLVVHCSAGVGRTGTFIALHRLIQHVRKHEFVDILGLVADMRRHRPAMVQTEDQYLFVHKCVLAMWRERKWQEPSYAIVFENMSSEPPGGGRATRPGCMDSSP
ncbi:receptor-type tyrosine-protein phosphatase O-like isoform X1 [Petromyzon marinus]|uniref:protein-tyrosine-phosphatase n=2 Tax=Petromyzon marinus TaxID=7757 RepID=A0AAJ7SUC3_PETMA|nr:receptor-type tyrosine-protein phosphatase O-like isoform X1 [Petromyzon marinus]